MGGGSEIIEEQQTVETVTNESVAKTQEEMDIEYIKQNINMIKPIEGTVTSRYGPRTPTNIISANHAGIDIGASTGSPIIAAMDGTVTQVSTQGDYRKSFKNCTRGNYYIICTLQ